MCAQRGADCQILNFCDFLIAAQGFLRAHRGVFLGVCSPSFGAHRGIDVGCFELEALFLPGVMWADVYMPSRGCKNWLAVPGQRHHAGARYCLKCEPWRNGSTTADKTVKFLRLASRPSHVGMLLDSSV